MTQQSLFKIRDLRKKEQFIIDDIYLNGYAKICGIYATGVYVSLCRHADKEQKSFPSIRKLAEELNISVASVKRGLNLLEKYNIIKRERLGKKLNNRYYLIDKSEWSDRAITVSPQSHHQGSIGAIHSKDTQYKDTHSKDIATQGVAVNEVITLFKSINPSYEKFFSNTTQRAAVGRMLSKLGREKLEGAIKAAGKANGIKYAPTITTPLQLEDKMGSLIAFIQKEKNQGNKIVTL